MARPLYVQVVSGFGLTSRAGYVELAINNDEQAIELDIVNARTIGLMLLEAAEVAQAGATYTRRLVIEDPTPSP